MDEGGEILTEQSKRRRGAKPAPRVQIADRNGRVRTKVVCDPKTTTKKNDNNLTPRQEILAASYVHGVVSGKSDVVIAREAGYTQPTGLTQALKSPDVQARIDEHVDEVLQELGWSRRRIMVELLKHVTFDMRQLYNEAGELLEPYELAEETTVGVIGLDVEQEYDGKGVDRVNTGRIMKYKLANNRLEALKMLTSIARIDGPQRVEMSGRNGEPVKVTLTDLDQQLLSVLDVLRQRKAQLEA